MPQIGRRNLFSDTREVTKDNVIKILTDVQADFQANRNDCQRLLDIEAGYMPIARQKTSRPEIDVKTVDSIAHEIVEFKVGYHFGNTINFVSRGLKDSGNSDETAAIAILNEYYNAENIGRKQKAMGYYVETTGIGYSYVNVKSDWKDGESLFEVETLDPRFAFVVRSSLYTDHRVILGVTFRQDKEGNTYYTAFTDKYRFDITNLNVVLTSRNLVGMIPIVEWERSTDRMGVFEREIPEMERLNLILSDIGNDVESECNMIWHLNDCQLPMKKDADGNDTDEIDRPKSGEWIVTETTKDGKSPFIKPLITNYDYAGLLNNYTSARALILERTYTPQRNGNNGSSTGLAIQSATGYESAEQAACAQQLLIESSKMDEVRVALAVIKASTARVPDEKLLALKPMDLKPNVTRTKLYEMTVKTTALANMLSHGIHGLHALRAVNFFEDVNAAWEDSKDLIEKYQNHAFGVNEEVKPSSVDPINQITNSPLVDSIGKEAPVEETE